MKSVLILRASRAIHGAPQMMWHAENRDRPCRSARPRGSPSGIMSLILHWKIEERVPNTGDATASEDDTRAFAGVMNYQFKESTFRIRTMLSGVGVSTCVTDARLTVLACGCQPR